MNNFIIRCAVLNNGNITHWQGTYSTENDRLHLHEILEIQEAAREEIGAKASVFIDFIYKLGD